MKKKLFGRAGAIGLAGLSAFSAMSIVASADISYGADSIKTEDSGAEKSYTVITGTAWKIRWQYKETTHNYQVIGGTLTDNTDVATTGTVNTYDLDYTAYYGYSTNAQALVGAVDAAIKAANETAKAQTVEWEEYAFYMATNGTESNKSQKIGDRTIYYIYNKETSTGGYYTDNKGENTATIQQSAPSSTPKTYETIVSPSRTQIDMATLVRELGTKYVKFNTGAGKTNEILADTASSAEYILSTTGSTGTGSTGSTTVGGYAAYVIPSGYRTWSSTIYRSGLTWYPNLNAMYVATGSWAYDAYKVLTESYSSSKAYFDPVTGTYISNSAYTSSNYPYAVYITGTDTTRDETAIYKVGNLYYYTWTSAYNAANSDATKVEWIRDYTATGAYFSRITGYFYSTYEAAVAASNGYSTYVVAVNGSGYYYDDPYYYYYLMRAQSGSSSSSSSNLGGSSVTIGNKSGWSSVRTSIRNASTGTTLNVNMGSETSIPEEILSALNGKNVTVNFTLSNGSVISFNGRDISSPKDIYVKVTYNSTNIPSALIKKAKSVNNAVSSAQVSVTNNTFGGSGSLTVKFNTNRANYTAKLYRYNSSKNSLQLIDTSIVASTGRVTFDKVTQGGDYVIVLS